jgi:hypothetical protein
MSWLRLVRSYMFQFVSISQETYIVTESPLKICKLNNNCLVPQFESKQSSCHCMLMTTQ